MELSSNPYQYQPQPQQHKNKVILCYLCIPVKKEPKTAISHILIYDVIVQFICLLGDFCWLLTNFETNLFTTILAVFRTTVYSYLACKIRLNLAQLQVTGRLRDSSYCFRRMRAASYVLSTIFGFISLLTIAEKGFEKVYKIEGVVIIVVITFLVLDIILSLFGLILFVPLMKAIDLVDRGSRAKSYAGGLPGAMESMIAGLAAPEDRVGAQSARVALNKDGQEPVPHILPKKSKHGLGSRMEGSLDERRVGRGYRSYVKGQGAQRARRAVRGGRPVGYNQ